MATTNESTVARIGAALGYDAAEAALANGVSLADVLAMVASHTVVCIDASETSASAKTVRPNRAA